MHLLLKTYSLIALSLICFMTDAFAQATVYSHPKYEVRAVWLTTIGGLDWPKSYNAETQRQQLCEILDKLKDANINTILLQTRIRATTIYPSAYEPFDGCITGHPGKRPSYDPLAFAVEECHKRGMEIHAWIVTIPIGKWNGLGCKSLRQKHPNLVKKIGDEGFLNPETAETADYVSHLCEEIVSAYDVDGIHLDYVRYPETWKNIGNKRTARKNITRIVNTVYNRTKAIKPWIKVSAAPIGKFDDLTRYSSNGWNAYSRVCQDVQEWMKDGIVDMIFPMMYFKDNNFYPFAIDWKENDYDRTIAAGLGIYFMSPSEKNWNLTDISRELMFCRSQEMGFAMFRTKHFLDDTKGIYQFVKNEFCPYPALSPPLKWDNSQFPSQPNDFVMSKTNSVTTASWQGRDDGALYNVYASHAIPVDICDARNLISVRQRSNNINITHKNNNETLYFAITQIDRFGNESTPVYSYDTSECEEYDSCRAGNPDLLHGSRLYVDKDSKIDLSGFAQITDIKYVIITNLNNQIITYLQYDSQNKIDVSGIKEIAYIVRTANKKGKTHKLGYVINL